MRTTLRTLIGLAALLAFAGVATAQNLACPECDEDGAAEESNYFSVDAGAVDEPSEALVDTDAATSNENTEGGFFAWLSVCLSAFLEDVSDALGIELDANVEAFVDSDGVDIDGVVQVGDTVVDIEDDVVGDLDDQTYEAIAQIESATGADVEIPNVLPDLGAHDIDACLTGELNVVTC